MQYPLCTAGRALLITRRFFWQPRSACPVGILLTTTTHHLNEIVTFICRERSDILVSSKGNSIFNQIFGSGEVGAADASRA